ncbi:MAG: FAD-binding protein [Pseudomonadota bacterium]
MTVTSEADIAEQVKDAAAKGTAIRITGGGTRRNIGNHVDADASLSTSELSGVTLYEPGALTLVAKSGTPLSEVDALLAKEGQMLAFEPTDHRKLSGSNGATTLGGIVATNASGPRRIQAGACRDALLGVRFVDGEGTIVKNGGRVMKNVTGYDLVKLMSGAFGTLGVLTEVSFKVLPKPEATTTLIVEGLDMSDAQAVMSDALKTPYDVSGAAYDARKRQTFIRLEGFPQSVRYRANMLAKELKPSGPVDMLDGASIWQNITAFAFVDAVDGDIWQLSTQPTDGPKLIRTLMEQADVMPLMLDWSGGLVTLATPPGTDIRGIWRAHSQISGEACCIRGHADYFRQSASPLAALEAGLRKRFDPKGVLNPGVLG